MKKFAALLLSVMTVFILAVPCFAASTVKFNVNLVSENDTTAVISFDYAGGSSFCALDFEVKYNAQKLKVNSAINGNGVNEFAKYVQKSGGAILTPMINSASNPIKVSMATTIPFKVVNGKDICVITFKKLSKGKITTDDVSVRVTTCTSANGSGLKTDVSSSIGGTPVTTSAPSESTSKVTSKTSANNSKTSSAANSSSASKTSESTSVSANSSENSVSETVASAITNDGQPENTPEKNTKKIVVVAAAAICMLFVIAAVCVYVVKKTKKNDGEAE